MQACVSATGKCQNQAKLPPDQTSYNFTDLLPHTNYTFTVKAFTATGDSDSKNVTAKTSEHSEFHEVCMVVESLLLID